MNDLIANHIWQSTLCACAAGLLVLLCRRLPARVRFWIISGALVKFLVPLAVLTAIGSRLSPRPATHLAEPGLLATVESPFQPPNSGFIAPLPGGPLVPEPKDIRRWALLTIWALGFIAGLAYWIAGWRRVSAAIRSAGVRTDLLPEFPVPVLLIEAGIEPGVFGIVRPVLVLPSQIAGYTTHEQLECIAAHERCHIERRDNLWSFLCMLIQAAFWFHPLVWWLGGHLLIEREHACDEAVLNKGGSPKVYAEAVLQVCRYSTGIKAICVSGVSSSNLERRIAAILSYPLPARFPRWVGPALIGLALTILIEPLTAGWILGRQAPGSSTGRTFDAISIRSGGPSPDGRFCRGCMRPNQQDPKATTMVNFTLRALVCFAYVENRDNCDYKLATSDPTWFTSDYFNINAHTDDPATPLEKRQMMQTALSQYFHLVLRREMRMINGYEIEVAAHGPKLKPAVTTDHCGQWMVSDKSDDHTLSWITIAADCVSIDDIASVVQEMLFPNQPVRNRTGLPGTDRYQINLEVASERSAALSPQAAQSVFSALPDQLGLKLVAAKIPVDVLVMESAQHPQPD